MEYPIFDTHAHYSARAFDADRFALLDSLPGKGVVGVCEQATHSGDAPKVLELAHKYSWVYAAVGIHPESLLAPEDCGEEGPAPTVSVYGGDWAAEMRALAPYYEDPKVVAVGECGLDYHWPVPKDAQLALFEAEIRLALELDKPIIVHDRSAHADVYALLKKYRPKGIVHCYSGSADDVLWLAEQGLYIGFGGACTFKGAKRAAKAIAALPLERIVLETDCPYMAPEPVRGTRCDSSLIRYVGEYIASVKGEEPEQVFRQCGRRRVAGPAGAVFRLRRRLHLQGCQTGGKGHCGSAFGADRPRDGLPLHGSGAGARHPLRQLPHPVRRRVCRQRQGHQPGGSLPPDGAERQSCIPTVRFRAFSCFCINSKSYFFIRRFYYESSYPFSPRIHHQLPRQR